MEDECGAAPSFGSLLALSYSPCNNIPHSMIIVNGVVQMPLNSLLCSCTVGL